MDLSRVNVIYMYQFPTIIDKRSEKIAKEYRKGTRILAHDHPLKGLAPAKSIQINDKSFHTHTINLYRVE
ncbi:MAG: hypothetical protein QW791_09315 [Candidatus Bathyarchaeia archaeon]